MKTFIGDDGNSTYIVTDSGSRIDYSDFVAALMKKMDNQCMDVLHACVGIAGEGGEILDQAKKHWAYNKPLDVANIIEELGDLEFYMQALRNTLGLDREEIVKANMDKLLKRYEGMVYSDTAAQLRADKPAGE